MLLHALVANLLDADELYLLIYPFARGIIWV